MAAVLKLAPRALRDMKSKQKGLADSRRQGLFAKSPGNTVCYRYGFGAGAGAGFGVVARGVVGVVAAPAFTG